MSTQLWPKMRTVARVHVNGCEVFIIREWSSVVRGWVRSLKYYRQVSPSSLARLKRLYAVRQFEYAPGRFEKYRTRYPQPLLTVSNYQEHTKP